MLLARRKDSQFHSNHNIQRRGVFLALPSGGKARLAALHFLLAGSSASDFARDLRRFSRSFASCGMDPKPPRFEELRIWLGISAFSP